MIKPDIKMIRLLNEGRFDALVQWVRESCEEGVQELLRCNPEDMESERAKVNQLKEILETIDQAPDTLRLEKEILAGNTITTTAP